MWCNVLATFFSYVWPAPNSEISNGSPVASQNTASLYFDVKSIPLNDAIPKAVPSTLYGS